jgi:hypothetical protein
MSGTRTEIRQAAVAALEAAGLEVGGRACRVDTGRYLPYGKDDFPLVLVHTRQSSEEVEDHDGVYAAVTELTVEAAVAIGAMPGDDAAGETAVEALLAAVRAAVFADAALAALVRQIPRVTSTIDDPEMFLPDGQPRFERPVREAVIVFEVEHEIPAD